MKKLLFFVFLLLNYNLFSCCAAFQYRLFPIGESNKNIIFIEMNLSRYCVNLQEDNFQNQIWWTGNVNLKMYNNGVLELVKQIDTVNFMESAGEIDGPIIKDSTIKQSLYFENMFFYYSKALKIAQTLPNFTNAKTKKIIFNDSTDLQKIDTDSSIILILKKNKIEVKMYEIISCYPVFVNENRFYETENFKISVVRLSCGKLFDQNILTKRKSKFKKLRTAFWEIETYWHSITKDYLFIEKR